MLFHSSNKEKELRAISKNTLQMNRKSFEYEDKQEVVLYRDTNKKIINKRTGAIAGNRVEVLGRGVIKVLDNKKIQIVLNENEVSPELQKITVNHSRIKCNIKPVSTKRSKRKL